MATQGARDTPELIHWLAVLGDLTRLRILHLLEREELGVGEIARITQLPQSTISRHLRMLLETNWVAKRQVGTASLYRILHDAFDPDARTLWTTARNRLAGEPAFADDASRLPEVVGERVTDSRAFFGRLGGEWDELRSDLFGERFTGEALLALVNPDAVVADIGCGTGQVSELLAPHVHRVIAVDREPAMIAAARKRLKRFTNIEFRRGEIGDLPLQKAEVDIALLSLVLHHVDDPGEAIEQIAGALRPRGVMMVLDMISHDRKVYRHTMGHVHLGFSEKDVRAWATRARLGKALYRRLRLDTKGKGPGLFVATMRKK